MNREEAKYLLHAYRVGGQDASDPQFREALELLKQDPELAQWFAEDQAIHRRLADKFSKLPVPGDLKTQLLATRKIMQPVPWWKKPMRLAAAAAAIALLVCSLAVWFSVAGREKFADFRSFAATMAATKMERLDFTSQDPREVKQWLANRGDTPADFVIPAGLNGRPSIGCCVMNWHGQKVSMVCFEMENRKVAHLFVVDRARLRNVPSMAQALTAGNGINTVAWSDRKNVYVLAGKQGEEDLMKLL